MKPLAEHTKQYKVEPKAEEWKELGKEMTSWFGKNCYWIPWKFPMEKINSTFFQLKKEGDREYTHLLQRLYKG